MNLSNNMKTKLHIDFCSHSTAKYACENWHYSKCTPHGSIVKFGVWEDDKFIGVILYSKGAAPNLLKRYKLKHTEGCELTRIALREHRCPVSKMISISIKLLKKHCPGLKLIISFADPNEGHNGGIYQATNWIFTGKSKDENFYKFGDKIYHRRTAMGGKIKPYFRAGKRVLVKGKYRYLMPLTNEMMEKVKHLKLPYPKKRASEIGDVCVQQSSGGAIPTQTLQLIK